MINFPYPIMTKQSILDSISVRYNGLLRLEMQ